jgi:hypothetical protein
MKLLQNRDNGGPCPFVWQEYRIFLGNLMAGSWGVLLEGTCYLGDAPTRYRELVLTLSKNRFRLSAPEFGRFRVTIFVIQLLNNPNFLTNARKSLPARGLRVFLRFELNVVRSEWLDWHDDNHLSHRLHSARNDYSRTGSSGGGAGL